MFWHLAGSLFLFRWIFRDPKVDVRFLLAGALLPDVVDLPLGTLILGYGSGEVFAHTLLAPTVLAAAVLSTFRRGRRRRAWMALVTGWMFHLLLDGMWTRGEVLLWPLLGDFPRVADGYWAGLPTRLLEPWRWLREAAGLGYLTVLWRRAGLHQPDVRREVVRSGRLPSRAWTYTSP